MFPGAVKGEIAHAQRDLMQITCFEGFVGGVPATPKSESPKKLGCRPKVRRNAGPHRASYLGGAGPGRRQGIQHAVRAAVASLTMVGALACPLPCIPCEEHVQTMEQRIPFAHGSRTAEVEGGVSAGLPAVWRVGAKAGQLLMVELLDAEPSVSLSIESPPGRDGASEVLATKTRQWGKQLHASGDYTIRVETDLPRSSYKLKVTLSNIKTLGP